MGNRDFSKGEGWEEKHFGSNEVKSLEVVGEGDLTKQMKFVSPDDGNAEDRTVFEIALPGRCRRARVCSSGFTLWRSFRRWWRARATNATSDGRAVVSKGWGVWNGRGTVTSFMRHGIFCGLWHLRREADLAGKVECGLQRRADRGQGERRRHADVKLPCRGRA